MEARPGFAHAAPFIVPLDPRILTPCLDGTLGRRLGQDDRQALRAALPRATQAGHLLAADGQALGRILPHGSVALYRPDPAASLRHRLLDVGPGPSVLAAFRRDPAGELEEAWAALADGGAVGL